MPLANHIEALNSKHAFLEHLIREESQRPCPDFVMLTDYKKTKLQIKEELARLSRDLPYAGSA